MVGEWARALGRRYWIAYGACAVASLAVLWLPGYLPMVDLPQHAALVSAWLHRHDPTMGLGAQFEVHPFTPYVLPYLLAVGLGWIVGVPAALKLLLSLAVLGLPLAAVRMVARRGGDPWLALWCVPLAFGVSFRWGFLSHVVAAPLCLVLVDEGERYLAAPTRRSALAVAALGAVLFFAHLVVLAMALAVLGLLALVRAPSWRAGILRLWPLAVPVGLTAAWAASVAGRDPRVSHWEWGFTWNRLAMLPQVLFDAPWPATMSVPLVDARAGAAALALVAALSLARLRPSRDPGDWLPAAAAGALYLLGPFSAFSSFIVSDRFALFLLPFALAALRAAQDPAAARAARRLTVAAVLGWMALLGADFWRFDREEMAPFDRVAALVRPGAWVAGLVFEPRSEWAGGAPALMHAAGWIQADKGGIWSTNFGSFVNLPVQYRPGREPPHTERIQWDPKVFRWEVDGRAEYFLVRAGEPPDDLFAGAPAPVVLVGRERGWWLYRRLPGERP